MLTFLYLSLFYVKLMRVIFIILLVSIWLPVLSQSVLTITDARKANPVAPYVYYLEDQTHKLTYEQVASFPLDSFQKMREKEFVQLMYRTGTLWLRFAINNQTDDELLLLSSHGEYQRMDVYTVDKTGKLSIHKVGPKYPLTNRYTSKAQPIVSLGHNPDIIYVAINKGLNIIGDYMYVANGGNAIHYRTYTSFWQGLVLGTFLLFFLYALIFFWRLRDPLIGWYVLFVFGLIQFFLDFYGFYHELIGHAYFTHIKPFYHSHAIYQLCWSLLYIKFLNLWHKARLLYYIQVSIVLLTFFDQFVQIATQLMPIERFSPLGTMLLWGGADWGKYYTFDFFVKLICLVYVSYKDFRAVSWYALGLGFSLVSMVIAMLALYNFSWLPYLPYNNAWVVGNLLEIAIIGYALAERASQHRTQQNRTQQSLIAQLQENLLQRDKLLRIRDEIARDLHDEVGATLTSIAISTKLVQKKVGLHQADIEPILAQIKADSEDTIHSIRDTVWALNPDNDAPEKFLERLRTVAFQMLANQDISLTFDSSVVVVEALPPFSMELRRNLYLVYKEVLHNIVKHAHASKVCIQIRHSEGYLQVTVSDNGQGFDTTAQTDGNGLINFQKRADAGEFIVRVQSESGTGTTIFLQVPIQEANTVAFHPALSL